MSPGKSLYPNEIIAPTILPNTFLRKISSVLSDNINGKKVANIARIK